MAFVCSAGVVCFGRFGVLEHRDVRGRLNVLTARDWVIESLIDVSCVIAVMMWSICCVDGRLWCAWLTSPPRVRSTLYRFERRLDFARRTLTSLRFFRHGFFEKETVTRNK